MLFSEETSVYLLSGSGAGTVLGVGIQHTVASQHGGMLRGNRDLCPILSTISDAQMKS